MGFFDPFGGSSGSGGGGIGIPGKDGRGISTIDFLSSSIGSTPGIQGAIDTYQIKYTDGTKTTYVIKNGEKGSKGDKGDIGATGLTGPSGSNGNDGISVTKAEIRNDNHLYIILSNNTEIDAGTAKITGTTFTNYSFELDPNSWTSEKRYILNGINIVNISAIFINPSTQITEEQYAALAEASIIATDHSSNTLTLKAMGDIPNIRIPIVVTVGG